MKKILLGLGLAVSLFANNTFVQTSEEWEKSQNNQKYSSFQVGLYGGYVLGVTDTLNHIVICLDNDTNSKQILSIVRKYIKEHPEKWNGNNLSLIIPPLKEAFPCKKK